MVSVLGDELVVEPMRPGLPAWEQVGVHLWRVDVPGGWLYRVASDDGEALAFVPKPPVNGTVVSLTP